ncbi:cobyric acid synthase [Ilyobacter polytropus]|uniref:Cobyric acid synthase n=1 Tax=Ilyobacter polytropus (strain ATCC 51220 / DSM 2926 / LMG 16218 / CuHBu1) TaxID=572544 RepID=E3HDD3_ILYPC|nr:cobyric acid synthase [Ilyobacter polytropus]ADO84133.1 adenosylcobyric acid synthase (glutamine-hydrolysing) [Ilyobacter polytropus DSM 2926]
MKKHKNIMVQGTASSVGKSLVTTALCRILYKDGYSVCPFKSQNMALNSFITEDGKEMGRAQVVQAEACGIKPEAFMNPILLKPTTDRKSQVILNGKALRNMTAREYHEFKPSLKEELIKIYSGIKENYDTSVIEGAGSTAEINLKEGDIVNMGMAEIADSPVILVSDIDRGGVFASILGTLMLLEDHERERVKGVIINKFRGDVGILKPGIKQLEEIIKKPILGVLPYSELDIEDEDSVTERFKKYSGDKDIRVSVIRINHMSNFTDLDALGVYEDVSVKYITKAEDLGNEDIIIIPGSKSTIDDLKEIKDKGIAEKIVRLAKKGTIIFGICGGYQMLGQKISDPDKIESSLLEIPGIGLLDMETVMKSDKRTVQYEGKVVVDGGFLEGTKGMTVKGYEIHQGITNGNEGNVFLQGNGCVNGAFKDNIIGTYIHGIFDNSDFTRKFLNNIRKNKGLDEINDAIDFQEFKEREFDKLADIVREHLDMEKIYKILEGENVECDC